MNLNQFNAETLPQGSVRTKTKPARVSFGKNGTISFNEAACHLMGINAGEKVSLAQNDDKPEEWYFFGSENGFELRPPYDKKNGKGLILAHQELVRSFREAFDLEEKTIAFELNDVPVTVKGDSKKYWLIVSTD